MASAQQIIALVRSHTRGDDDRFRTIAGQLASEAERRGQNRIAAELKGLLSDVVADLVGRHGVVRKSDDPIPIHRLRGELSGLMAVTMPEARLTHMVMDDPLRSRLTKIVKEQQQRERLLERALAPRRKFLLVGPPGTGKTTSASAIAGELALPLFTVQLDGLITRYMGDTASKLRLIFDAMSERRGVYFFDEVDALATQRGGDNDVGEARRILNSFLMMLDDEKSSSLIFAATNHPELLDRAFFRRFQARIEFRNPEPVLVRPLLEILLMNFQLDDIDWQTVENAVEGLSHAEISLAGDDAARDAVLENGGVLTTQLLVESLTENRRSGR